jgi:tetratricopeptide (TPR) repeat protein
VEAYKEVLDICERKGMRSRLSWHYLNVGKGYLGINEEEKAITYFRDAIKVIDDVNQQARALALANLGYCYLRGGMHSKALELLDKAYPLFKDKRDKNLANIEWWKGRIFEVQNRRNKALRHYFKALEHAKNGQDYKQITGILRDIANWYAHENDYKNAYDYQRFYENAIEKYLLEVKESEIRELEVKYEAERKEKEAEMFKLQATGLQLKALRAQMNPHFVFNALNSVQNFITSNDNTLAAKYLAQFAHLMRQSLEYSDVEIISLEKEIEFLKNYLDINQKLRFENKMSYRLEVDEDIEEDILGVPTMIIQPYIENAIEHGIRSKKKGLVQVKFSLEDENTILCSVEDNGVGRKRARELQLENPNFKDHRSLGTKITNERLEILNRTSGNLKREVVKIIDLKDESTGKPLGTRVEVLIPVIEIQMK